MSHRIRHILYNTVCSLASLALLLIAGSAHASLMSSPSYTVRSDVLSTGIGTSMGSASYRIASTLGQSSPIGGGAATTFVNSAGFWFTAVTPGLDSDGDGLTNQQEGIIGTNPNNPDTDGDGFNDGVEVAMGSNPLLAASVPYSIIPSPASEGTITGVSAANNLLTGYPKIDLDFDFIATVTTINNATPQSVKVYLTQRTSPGISDFTQYPMTCTGTYQTGATCTMHTKLGPAAAHKFYFEMVAGDGTVLRNPPSGYLAGPSIELLNGYSLAGAARDVDTSGLDGLASFGSSTVYRWVSTGLTTDSQKGSYELIDSANPNKVKTGEGYFVKRVASPLRLPELAAQSDVTASTVTVALLPGWNIISNPYVGNVLLSTVQIKRGAATPVPWLDAASYDWVVNAIYYYQGTDWSNTYGFEAAGGLPNATLVPWLGYWVYVNKDDAVYTLIIPKP